MWFLYIIILFLFRKIFFLRQWNGYMMFECYICFWLEFLYRLRFFFYEIIFFFYSFWENKNVQKKKKICLYTQPLNIIFMNAKIIFLNQCKNSWNILFFDVITRKNNDQPIYSCSKIKFPSTFYIFFIN